jgi:hypothetical protein
MGRLNFDLEGNELPKAEGSRYLGGMVRPVAREFRLDPKPAKIFERPAEPLAKPKVEELRETVEAVPSKKMGRPSKGKPWVEAGVSKASWYRQQKSAKPSEGKGEV